MDIIKFVKVANRMCKRGGPDCSDCCLKKEADFCIDENIAHVPLEELEKVIHVAEKWAKEHPAKTRKTEFLKMFPNAQFEADSYSPICPHALDETWKCRRTNCKSCRQDFWNQEV